MLCQKDDFLQTLQTNIATVVRQGDSLSPEVIDERLRDLQKELVKKANQKDDYDAIADEILRLREMRKQAEVDSVVKPFYPFDAYNPIGKVDIFAAKVRDFCDAIKEGRPAPIPGEEILYNQAICDGIYRSARLGEEVKIEIPEI